MRSIIIIIFLITPFGSIAQTGKKANSNNGIEGIWINNESGFERTLTLNAGGYGEFDGEKIQYKISGNRLITISAGETTNYQYEFRSNKLTLSFGDLDKAVTFYKKGAGQSHNDTDNPNHSHSTQSNLNSIVGKWESNSESLDFRNDGIVIIQGNSMSYSISGNNLTIQSPNGTQNFTFSIQSDYLTININGQSQVYKRSGSLVSNPTSGFQIQQTPDQNQGSIDPQLVGKWCYLNTSSSGNGSQSTDECIVINSDGTYEFNYESSGGAPGSSQSEDQTFAGESGSQSSDRGTWSLAGSTLYVQSQSKGNQIFTLQKINNPKNGDPMIVINGRSYVTYYQKPGW